MIIQEHIASKGEFCICTLMRLCRGVFGVPHLITAYDDAYLKSLEQNRFRNGRVWQRSRRNASCTLLKGSIAQVHTAAANKSSNAWDRYRHFQPGSEGLRDHEDFRLKHIKRI